MIDTSPGATDHGGFTIRLDTHNYGVLTVEGVIQKSSNVGTTKIAMKMQPHEMWDLFTPGGLTGKSRKSVFPARFPAACALTRHGARSSRRPCPTATVCRHRCFRWPAPTPCLRGTVTSSRSPCSKSCGTRWRPVQVFSARTAGQVRKMLQMAAGPGGTGQKAQTMGYSVGGKSGTAYKQIGKGYGSDKEPQSTAAGLWAWRRSTTHGSWSPS
jgi:cell division protein FtsI (penicillin-binding protein 3)